MSDKSETYVEQIIEEFAEPPEGSDPFLISSASLHVNPLEPPPRFK
jgi:hypothetical protein